MKHHRLFAQFVTMLMLAGLLVAGLPAAFADSPVVSTFPQTGQFKAQWLKDHQDVALIELTGDYGSEDKNGKTNVEPRTVVAKEFYRTHADTYDFIVVFSKFEFETGDARAFMLGVSNKVTGTGREIFDNSAQFGSQGKLQSYIDMAALSRYGLNPYNPDFDGVLRTFAHEFAHQFGAFLSLNDADGKPSKALLGKDDTHWSFLLNSGASVMLGNEWRDNGNGSFTSVGARSFFSPLDLYLMGMYRKDEVPPFFLIENPDLDRKRVSQTGVTVSGKRRDVTIDEIVAANGERSPNAAQAQKQFRLGFVLLTRPGEPATEAELVAVDKIRQAVATRMAAMTGGRALLQSYLEPRPNVQASTPVTPTTPPRTGGVDPAAGLVWLRARQDSDGKWSDHPYTSLRDTAVVVETLNDVDGAAFSGHAAAMTWLRADAASNTDYLARKLHALRGASTVPTQIAPQLLALQNTDGGWGVAAGYHSNALDTALVMTALRPLEAGTAQAPLAAAQAFLIAHQNADGGWGNLSDGVSRTAVTTAVLQAMQGRAGATAAIARAVTYLASRQQQDGGFGDGASTVHDSANVVLALLAQNALGAVRAADARSYIASLQRSDGSWDGSVYASAMALRVLKSAGMFNWSMGVLTLKPRTPVDGQQVVVSFVLSNNGSAAAPAGMVRIADGATRLGADMSVPPLAPGASVNLQFLWNTLEQAGPHELSATVDPDNTVGESSKSDNRAATNVTVLPAPAAIDLAVNVSDLLASPSRPTRVPSIVALSALVSNIGRSDAAKVRIVLREGSGTDAVLIDEKTINLLGRTSQTVNFNIPLSRAGTHLYTVTIDPDGLLAEPERANNSAAISLETTSALDVEVLPADLSVGAGPLFRGTDISFKVKIRNAATVNAPPFKVAYRVAGAGKTVPIVDRVVQIASGASIEQDVVWQADMAGQLQFVVELDPDQVLSESDRSNNMARLALTVVDATGPNLSASFKDLSMTPATALEAKPLVLTQLVRNSGTVATQPVQAAFYDGDPKAGKLIGTMQLIPALAPGASHLVSVTWPRYPDASDRTVFFVADPLAALTEITRDDNTAFLTLSSLSMADLAVSAGEVQTAPAAPKPGEAITLTARISNLGRQGAGNVLVRVLDGDLLAGGKPAAPDQLIASLDGLASTSLTFQIPAAAGNGARALVVVVDPDSSLDEKTRANNVARRDLLVQSADFYVSERYFSPNGDTVKDSTSLGFRLAVAADVTVQVLNQSGAVVRSFSGPDYLKVQSGSATWDGRNQQGVIAPDGNYRLVVRSSGGAVLGEAPVTLDNNRSPLSAALGTPFEYKSNLTCEIGYAASNPFLTTSDEQRVYFNTRDPGTFKPARAQANGTDIRMLLSPEMSAMGGWTGISASLNGEKLAFWRSHRPAPGRDVYQLWITDGDGANPRLLRETGDSFYGSLSANGTVFHGFFDGKWIGLPTDGVTAETVLGDLAALGFAAPVRMATFSPDRSKVLLKSAEHYGLVDFANGRIVIRSVADMDKLGRELTWSPDSRWLAAGHRVSDMSVDSGRRELDVVWNVIDDQLKLFKAFRTSMGSIAPGWQGAVNTTPVSWAADGSAFVFGHSYCNIRCDSDSADGVAGDPVAASAAGGQHVVMRADLESGVLSAIEATRARAFVNEEIFALESLVWPPHDTSVLLTKLVPEPAYRAQQVVPFDPAGTASTFTTPIGEFLPSGRKMIYRSRELPTPDSACYGSDPHTFTSASLLNLTADLRPLRRAGGLVLQGSAADSNFARYTIEYARASAPGSWTPVMPASAAPLVDGVFTTWIPPGFGAYVLRLRVDDLAGNSQEQQVRVNWDQSASITDLYKDREFISPNGDRIQDAVTLHYRVLHPVHLDINIFNQAGTLVRSFARDHQSAGIDALVTWDGRDGIGALLPDGQYRIVVQDVELFVTLDRELPKARMALTGAYGWNSAQQVTVAFAPTLSWASSDANYDSLLIERAAVGSADWQEVSRLSNSQSDGSLALQSAPQYVGMQYRITATDKAGNATTAVAKSSEQVFVLGHDGGEQRYRPLETRINHEGGIDQNLELAGAARSVTLRVAESLRLPFAKPVVMLRDIDAADDAWLTLAPQKVALSQLMSDGAVLDAHEFALTLDLSGLRSDKVYRLALELTDDDGVLTRAVHDYKLYWKSVPETLTIAKVDTSDPRALTVRAQESMNDAIVGADLLLKSADDPRFLVEQSIDTVQNPQDEYQHFLGADAYSALDLRCRKYFVRLRARLVSGAVVYSKPEAFTPNCFGASWKAEPVAALSCGDAPSRKIGITLTPFALDGRTLNQVLLGRFAADGRQDVLNNWNSVEADKPLTYALDVAGLAGPAATFFVRVIDANGAETTQTLSLPLSQTSPLARITSPAQGQKLCAAQWRADPASPLRSVVPVEGQITGDSNVAVELQYADGAGSPDWKAVQSKAPFLLSWSSKQDGHPGVPPFAGELAKLGSDERLDDSVSVRLRVRSAAGDLVCTAPTTFELDSRVLAAPSTLSREAFSGAAKAVPSSVAVQLDPQENVQLTITVAGAVRNGEGKLDVAAVPLRHLARGLALQAGAVSYPWDGKNDDGMLAADGLYEIRIVYVDSCGNERIETHLVTLDSTAPVLQVTNPAAAASVGATVPVLGTVRDASELSYTLAFALAASPQTWQAVNKGVGSTPAGSADQELAVWNTLGLSGAATLRLEAVDAVGNQSSVLVPVDIGAGSQFIGDLDTVGKVFSPNGDGQADQIALRYALLQNGRITIDIVAPGAGTPVRTLVRDSAASAGAGTAVWDGRNDQGVMQSDGEWLVRLSMVTNGGATVIEQASARFSLDLRAPTVTLHHPAGPLVAPAGQARVSVADANLATWQVYFSSAPAVGNWILVGQGREAAERVAVRSLDGLPSGQYAFKIVATDAAFNATELVTQFDIDAAAPKVALLAPLAGSVASARTGIIAVSGTVDETHLASYTLRYSKADAPATWINLASGALAPGGAVATGWNVTQLPDGAYTLSLLAIDQAGQRAEAQAAIVIDRVAPLALITTPANGSAVTRAADVLGSAMDTNLQQYSLDIAPGKPAVAARWSALGQGTTAVDNAVLMSAMPLLPDGIATLRLTVQDKAGNSTVAYSEIMIDTKPPTIPVLSAALENGVDAHLKWTASPDTDLAGYALYRNGVRVGTTLLTGTTHVEAGLAKGTHSYALRAVDQAGLESALSAPATVVVSLTDPIAQLFAPARESSVGATVEVRGTATAGKLFKEYRLSLGAGANPGAWQLLRRSPVATVADVLGSWNTAGLPENASYTLKLEAEDLNGAVASDRVTVTVDNVAPPAPVALAAVVSGDGVTLSWTASAASDVAGYLLMRNERVANAQGIVVGSLRPYLIVASTYADLKLPDGEHRYVVQAMDKAGNLSAASNQVTVALDTRTPRATIGAPLAGATVSASAFVQAVSPDTDIAAVQLQFKPADSGSWSAIAAPLTQAPYSASWDTAALTPGDYLLRAIATDKTAHTDTAPPETRVTVGDSTAPDPVTDLKAAVAGGEVTLTWSSALADLGGYTVVRTGPDGAVSESDVAAAPAASTVDSALADGAYRYHVVTRDISGNRSAASVAVEALVYTPQVVQPYTPTTADRVQLRGQTRAGGTLALEQRDSDGATGTVAVALDGAGRFVQNDVLLSVGDNLLSLLHTAAPAAHISKPAQLHVRRVTPLAAPTGVRVILRAGAPVLVWDTDASPQLFAHRVDIDGKTELAPSSPDQMTASSEAPDGHAAWSAADGEPSTSWKPDPARDPRGESITLAFASRMLLSALHLRWDGAGVVPDYDIEAWDGSVWVPLAQVRGNTAAEVNTPLTPPYLSDRVRVKLVQATQGAVALAELQASTLRYTTDGSLALPPSSVAQRLAVHAIDVWGVHSVAASIDYDPNDPSPLGQVVLSGETDGPYARLRWSAEPSGRAEAYVVLRDGAPVGQNAGQNMSDGPLLNGSYRYSVAPLDRAGKRGPVSNTLDLAVAEPLPAAPAALAASAAGVANALRLDWQHAAGAPLPAGYRVARADRAGGPYTPVAAMVQGSGYRDLGLQAGKRYYYVVGAMDQLGNTSAWSNEASATVAVATAPAAPQLFAPTDAASAIVTQNPSASVAGYAVPGADVELLRAAVSLANARAPVAAVLQPYALPQGSDGFEASADGMRVLALGEQPAFLQLDSGVVTPIPGASGAQAASLARSGHQVALVRGGELYVYDEGDSAPRRIGGAFAPEPALAWSPDSAQLAVAGRAADGSEGLWIMAADGSAARLLLAAPGGQFDARSMQWSPDGSRILYHRNGAARVVTLADGSDAGIDEARNGGAAAWSSDGSRIIYRFDDVDGLRHAATYRVADGLVAPLGAGRYSAETPRMLPLDNTYVVIEGGQVVQRAVNGDLLAQVGPAFAGSALATTPSGHAFYLAAQGQLVRADMPGTVRFAPITLDAGVNLLTARAAHGALVGSTAQPLSITLGQALAADLSIDAADIALAAPPAIAGTRAQVALLVRNRSAVASSTVTLLVELTDPAGARSTLSQRPLAPIAARSASIVMLDWTPALPGDYRVTVTIDAAQSAADADRTNNQASATLQAEPSQLALQLAVTAPASGRQLALAWNKPQSSRIAYYSVFAAPAAQGVYETLAASVQGDAYLDRLALDGVPRFYMVKAYDAAGTLLASSNEASGTARDSLAPVAPVLTGPARPGLPAIVDTLLVDVTGVAEPGAEVSLLRSGQVIKIGTASGVPALRQWPAVPQTELISMSDDGARFASATSFDKAIVVTDTASGASASVAVASPPGLLKWAPDGRSLAYTQRGTGWDESLYVYNDRDKVSSLAADLTVSQGSVAWSSNGARLAVVGTDPDGKTGLWLVDPAQRAARLLVAGGTAQFGDSMAWTPDDGHLAYVRDQLVQVAKTADGAAVFSQPDDAGPVTTASSLSWSPDGQRLLFAFRAPDYTELIGEYAPATGSMRSLHAAQRYNKVRSIGPDGDYLVQQDNNNWLLLGRDGEPKRDFGQLASNVQATRSGYLAYICCGQQALVRLGMPGVFRFDGVRLDNGANDLSAFAVDRAGLRSANAAPVRITLANPAGPDLAAGDASISILPAVPVAGEAVRLSATVRNSGTRAVDGAEVVLLVRDAAGATTELLASTMTALAPGEVRVLTADWTAGTAGAYSVVLSLDPANKVVELSEANNKGVRSIDVAATSLPEMTVTTAKALYGPGESLGGTVVLVNRGAALSGVVQMRIEDQGGFLVEMLAPVKLDNVVYGERISLPAAWNTGVVLAGPYRLAAQLLDSDAKPLAGADAPFSIAAVRDLRASVLVERAQYQSGQEVSVRASVELLSANSDLAAADAVIEVLDSKGAVLWSTTRALGTLVPGAPVALAVRWDSKAAPAGLYQVRLTVNAGGVKVAGSQAMFDIVQRLAVQVSGSVTPGAATVANGDRLQVTYVLDNAGSAALDVPLTVSIVDPDTQAVLATHDASVRLGAAASAQGQAAFDVAGWPLKLLQVALTATVDGKQVVLQRVSVRVADRLAPVPALVQPAPDAAAAVLLSGIETALVVKVVDAESRVATVEYALGQDAWRPMAAQATGQGMYQASLAGAADGEYVLRVRATDASGNESDSLTQTLLIDNTAPAVNITGVAEGGQYAAPVAAGVTVSDMRLASSAITLDGNAYVPGTPVIAAGPHVLLVVAADTAGNRVTRSIAFTVTAGGVAAPAIQFTAPANLAHVRGPVRLQVLTSVLPARQPQVEYQHNEGAWLRMDPDTASTRGNYASELQGLADGTQQFRARAAYEDSDSATALVTIVVDNTAPVIATGGVTDNGAYAGSVTPTFAATDAAPVTLVATLDGSAFVSGQAVTAGGLHRLAIRAVDQAGNVVEKVVNFQIVAPRSATLAAAPTVAVGSNLVFTATVANGLPAPNARLELRLNEEAGGKLVQTFTEAAALTGAPSFEKRFTWTAAGVAGTRLVATLWLSEDGEAARQFASQTLTLAAPKLNLSGAIKIAPAQAEVGSSAAIALTVSNLAANAVSGLKANVTITDALTGAVLNRTEDTLELAGLQSWNADRSWTVAGPAGTRYLVRLSATAGSETVALAEADITATVPVVKITLSEQSAGSRGLLVFAQCRRAIAAVGSTAFVACTNARATAFGNLLRAQTAPYTIVTTAKAFDTAFYSGGYGAYWISGNASRNYYIAERSLRVAMELGEGVIVDAMEDEDYDRGSLSRLMGVSMSALTPKLAASWLASTGASLPAGALPLPPSIVAAGLLSEAAPGKVEATFASSAGECGRHCGKPGIVSHQYGQARSMYFGLDLIDTIGSGGGTGASDLLKAALTHASASAHAVASGPLLAQDVAERVISIDNPGDARSVTLQVEVPLGMTVLDAGSGTLQTVAACCTKVSWAMALPAGQASQVRLHLRLPATKGAPTLRYTVLPASAGEQTALARLDVMLDVIDLAHANGVARAAIVAMVLSTPEEEQERNTFLSYMDRVDSQTAANYMWDPLESTCRHASLSIL